jgi:hypothetical protein
VNVCACLSVFVCYVCNCVILRFPSSIIAIFNCALFVIFPRSRSLSVFFFCMRVRARSCQVCACECVCVHVCVCVCERERVCESERVSE